MTETGNKETCVKEAQRTEEGKQSRQRGRHKNEIITIRK
jgi:hypothetical protein